MTAKIPTLCCFVGPYSLSASPSSFIFRRAVCADDSLCREVRKGWERLRYVSAIISAALNKVLI